MEDSSGRLGIRDAARLHESVRREGFDPPTRCLEGTEAGTVCLPGKSQVVPERTVLSYQVKNTPLVDVASPVPSR